MRFPAALAITFFGRGTSKKKEKARASFTKRKGEDDFQGLLGRIKNESEDLNSPDLSLIVWRKKEQGNGSNVRPKHRTLSMAFMQLFLDEKKMLKARRKSKRWTDTKTPYSLIAGKERGKKERGEKRETGRFSRKLRAIVTAEHCPKPASWSK